MLERFRYFALAWVLVMVTLVTAGTAVERAVETPMAETLLGEFCGKPPAELSCPKTGAIRCVCFLSGKKAETSPGELPSLAAQTEAPKLKKTRRVRILPQAEAAFSVVIHHLSPPTPPPRNR